MPSRPATLRQRLTSAAWPRLRIQARHLAEGSISGSHRSARKGSGVEFAEHRPYSPGDDLRHLDSHAMLRHGRLLIRQFQADTERAAYLICDCTASMAYRGLAASDPTPSKAEYALLLAAALAYVASKDGDAIGLSLLQEQEHRVVPVRATALNLARVLDSLELAEERLRTVEEQLDGDRLERQGQLQLPPDEASTLRLLETLTARLPKGSLIVVLSDFLQLSEAVERALLGLCSRAREVRAVQVLTRTEVDFPFEGSLRFIDPENRRLVQADADGARIAYKERLDGLTEALAARLTELGGRFDRVTTDLDPQSVLRNLLSPDSGALRAGRSLP